MSIFDGHEDKTPEELAKELGISDLSVVDNAGRETTEILKTLKNKDISNTEIEKADINRDSEWSKGFEIAALELGMRIRNKCFDNIGTIYKINDAERKITIKREDRLYNEYYYGEFETEVEVNLMDKCRAVLENGEWKPVISIADDIKKGVKIKIKNVTQQNLIVKKIEENLDNFVVFFDDKFALSLYTDTIERYKFFVNKAMKRTLTYEAEDIKIDGKCRCKYSGNIGTILEGIVVIGKRKEVKIYIEKEDRTTYVPLKDFFKKYQLQVPENPNDDDRVYGGPIETSPSGI